MSSLGYYVGYHYVITGDGTVTQCRKDTEMGAHVRDNNAGNIGICLTGNFMIEEPSKAQIDALEALTDKLQRRYGIKEVKAHRDYLSTKCCGDKLYDWLQYKKSLESKLAWLKLVVSNLLKKYGNKKVVSE